MLNSQNVQMPQMFTFHQLVYWIRKQVLRQHFQQQQKKTGLFYNTTLTRTLNLTPQTMQRHLSLYSVRLYLSSKVPLKLLHRFYICVVHKPTTTFWQLLTTIKDRDEPSHRQGTVNKIQCCVACQANNYIGERRLVIHSSYSADHTVPSACPVWVGTRRWCFHLQKMRANRQLTGLSGTLGHSEALQVMVHLD